MSERKINLGELFDNNFDCYTNFEDKGNYNNEPAISKDKFKELCLEFGKQLLKLASQNAEVEIMNGMEVNKQSILNTIKQVE